MKSSLRNTERHKYEVRMWVGGQVSLSGGLTKTLVPTVQRCSDHWRKKSWNFPLEYRLLQPTFVEVTSSQVLCLGALTGRRSFVKLELVVHYLRGGSQGLRVSQAGRRRRRSRRKRRGSRRRSRTALQGFTAQLLHTARYCHNLLFIFCSTAHIVAVLSIMMPSHL